MQFVCVLIEDNDKCKVVYGIEVGLFQCVGIFVVLCGLGNIEQVYKVNEYVEFVQFDVCDCFFVKVVCSLMVEIVFV